MESALAPHTTPLQELIDLSGRTAIVANVVVADLQTERAVSPVEQLLDLRPERAVAVTADVSDADDVTRLIDRTTGCFGRVDVRVSNADRMIEQGEGGRVISVINVTSTDALPSFDGRPRPLRRVQARCLGLHEEHRPRARAIRDHRQRGRNRRHPHAGRRRRPGNR